MMPAKIAVKQPIAATKSITSGARRKRTLQRATMYTPAVTIVAAWIRADTGVGPAIASGSHTYSGTCALLPIAPTKRQRQMIASAGVYFVGSAAAFENTSL